MSSRIRIIGGQWKRRLLPVPDSPGLRPTPDRVSIPTKNSVVIVCSSVHN